MAIERIKITQAMRNEYLAQTGIPDSCPICGDDVDIHEWYEVDATGPVNCDRSE